MRPAWRDYQGLHTLARTIDGVLRVAQVVKYGSQWKIRVHRADAWDTALDETVPTKREAKRRGEVALDLEPTTDLLPPAPTCTQIRAAAPKGSLVEDMGDCYELDVADGYTIDDLHVLVEHYDGRADKVRARRELRDRVREGIVEECTPDNENCWACGCFPEKESEK